MSTSWFGRHSLLRPRPSSAAGVDLTDVMFGGGGLSSCLPLRMHMDWDALQGEVNRHLLMRSMVGIGPPLTLPPDLWSWGWSSTRTRFLGGIFVLMSRLQRTFMSFRNIIWKSLSQKTTSTTSISDGKWTLGTVFALVYNYATRARTNWRGFWPGVARQANEAMKKVGKLLIRSISLDPDQVISWITLIDTWREIFHVCTPCPVYLFIYKCHFWIFLY